MTGDVCRICLGRPLRLKRAITVTAEHDTWTLAYLFTRVTAYQIKDNEPQIFCEPCKNELIVCFKFLKKCQETQEALTGTVMVKDEILSMSVGTELPELDPVDKMEDIKVEALLLEKEPEPVDPTVEESNEPFQESYSTDEDDQPLVKKSEDKRLPSKGLKSKQGQGLLKIVCPCCGKMVNKYYLKRHLQSRHFGELEKGNPFICDICSHQMTNKVTLLSHMKQHHMQEKKVCKVCGAIFRTTKHLLTHCRKLHPDLYPRLKCKFCDFETAHAREHYEHQKRHQGDAAKRYACSVCGRKFFKQQHRQRHEATHFDRRDFVCSVCASAFKTALGLQVHVAGVHGERKGYECPVCPRAFATNQNLRLHVTKQHPEYELPPPGTVMKTNAKWTRTKYK